MAYRYFRGGLLSSDILVSDLGLNIAVDADKLVSSADSFRDGLLR